MTTVKSFVGGGVTYHVATVTLDSGRSLTVRRNPCNMYGERNPATTYQVAGWTAGNVQEFGSSAAEALRNWANSARPCRRLRQEHVEDAKGVLRQAEEAAATLAAVENEVAPASPRP